MKLGTTTFFARDVEALAGFYGAALGLAQTVDDGPRYREVDGGGTRIGFAHQGAYEMLDLPEERDPSGLRSILTFALEDEEMDTVIERAVAHGAVLVKPPFVAHFGSCLAVLRDPEGNAFRLNGGAP